MTDQLIADMKLGQCLHSAIKKYVSMETDYEGLFDTFNKKWGKYEGWNLLKYQSGDTWGSLKNVGKIILIRFVKSYEEQDMVPILNESSLTYFGNKKITKKPDLIANKKGRITIVDFKFGKEWTQEEVDINEQLTEYAMIVSQALMEEPPIDVVICNLRKDTRDVRWIYGKRTKEQIELFIAKTDKELDVDEILKADFTPF